LKECRGARERGTSRTVRKKAQVVITLKGNGFFCSINYFFGSIQGGAKREGGGFINHLEVKNVGKAVK